jgi:hypothetical protein
MHLLQSRTRPLKGSEVSITLLPQSSNTQCKTSNAYTYGSAVNALITLQTTSSLVLNSLDISLVGTFEATTPQGDAYLEAQTFESRAILFKRTVSIPNGPMYIGPGSLTQQTWLAKLVFPTKQELQEITNIKGFGLIPTKGCKDGVYKIKDYSKNRTYARFTYEVRAEAKVYTHGKELKLKKMTKVEFETARERYSSSSELQSCTSRVSEVVNLCRLAHRYGEEERRARDVAKRLEATLMVPKEIVNGEDLTVKLKLGSCSESMEQFNLLSFDFRLCSTAQIGPWNVAQSDQDISLSSGSSALLYRTGQEIELPLTKCLRTEAPTFSTKHVSLAYYVEAKAQIEYMGRKYKMSWPSRCDKEIEIQILPDTFMEQTPEEFSEVVFLGQGEMVRDLLLKTEDFALPKYEVGALPGYESNGS